MVALFVVGTILACVLVDIGLRYAVRRRQPQVVARKALETYEIPVADQPLALKPRPNLLYSSTHLWLKLIPSGEFMVGIDDLMGKLVGRAERVLLPDSGKILRKGEVCCLVEQKNRITHFVMPFEGVVTYTNPQIDSRPQALNTEPYDNWLFLVKPLNVPDNVMNFQNLKTGDTANTWLSSEAERIRTFAEKHKDTVQRLFDVALPLSGDVWESFEKEFLSRSLSEK